MLTVKQLCYHLCYMLHTPVRLYDAGGSLLTQGDYAEDQEDPLVCDPDFASRLLAMRRDDAPVLHTECGSVIYAVLPASDGQTAVLGPFCYNRPTGAASQAVAAAHALTRPHAYRISFLPLDFAFESVALLFHASCEAPLSRDDLYLLLASEEDYTEAARSDAYSVIYQLRETASAHNSYAQELREQKAVREGNIEALKRSWSEVQTGQIGRLGKDELTHYRNLAVVIITLASRSAIEGGMLPELAYSLADAYTMKISELRDVAKISKLARSAELHFTELVQKAAGGELQNRHVARCKQMIHERLHQKISAQELADELGLSRSYLSQLFVQQEGLPLSAYILRAKVRASEYLLMLSDSSLEQIAATFGFASQSHYGQVFKRFNGITPGVFREQHQNRK